MKKTTLKLHVGIFNTKSEFIKMKNKTEKKLLLATPCIKNCYF